MGPLASLPRVDHLVLGAQHLVARYGRVSVTEALRGALAEAREGVIAGGAVPSVEMLVEAAERALVALRPGGPRRVVNAAGVVVHTNLGRAPLSEGAVAAVVEASGYCDLEIDLVGGGRGARAGRVDPLVAELVGAQDAIAVNNCAAALVLVLAALAGGGRSVAVSRGELVEIGGSFRLPEIMAAAGVTLVEVGTTNRTRARDFADAPGEVALLLKVHPSNYVQTGFTEAVDVAAMAAVARARGVPLVHDCGSGLLGGAVPDALSGALGAEPTLRGSLEAGADLVLASGDKLLGGPQAGLIAGRADLVDRCRRHPLARALRLDKLRIAALVATLESHLRGAAAAEVPVWTALTADYGALAARAETLGSALTSADVTVVELPTLVGGGSAPGAGVASPVVRIAHPAAHQLAATLRAAAPPILARVEGGALLLDLRTVDPADDEILITALQAAVASAT